MESRQTFFSYSRKDKEFALRLATDLKMAGVSVWIDLLNINAGERWDLEIAKALENSPILLVILSKASVLSNNVLDEVSYSLETDKRLVPIKIDNCILPFRLRRFQYIDFTQEYDAALEVLKASLISNKILDQKKSQNHVNPQASQIDIIEAETGDEVNFEISNKESSKSKKRKILFIGSVALVVLVLFLIVNPFTPKKKDYSYKAENTTPIDKIEDSNATVGHYKNESRGEMNDFNSKELKKDPAVSSQTVEKEKPRKLTQNAIDPSLASAGQKVFDVKCGSCHKLSQEKLVGPGLSGVTERRSREWLTHFFSTTSTNNNILEQCLVSMPNQALSNDEATSVYEFMRRNDRQN